MKIRCPHCGVRGTVAEDLRGRVARCPRCHEMFRVPAAVPTRSAEEAGSVSRSQEPDPGDKSSSRTRLPDRIEPPESLLPAAAETPNADEDPAKSSIPGDTGVEKGSKDDAPGDFPDLSAQSVAWENKVQQDSSVPPETEEDPVLPDEELAIPTAAEQTMQAELAALLSATCCRCGKTIPADTGLDWNGKQYCDSCHHDAAATEDSRQEAVLHTESPGTVAGSPPEKETIPVYSLGTGFGVTAVLKESWTMVTGVKGSIWGGIIVMLLALLALETAAVLLVPSAGAAGGGAIAVWVNLVMQVLGMVLSMTLLAGLLNIGVRRVAGTPYSWKTVASGFTVLGQIVVAGFLMSLLVVSGFFLLLLPGIYLAVGYSLTLPLIVDKGCGPWEAMEASRRIIHRRWWQVFAIYLVMYLIYLLSCVPLGIGMIWTIPMFFTLTGVLYRRLVPDEIPR